MKNLSRKEAAKVLEDMKVKIEIPKAAVTQWKRNTALDMAIEALNCSEFPNNSDTISRQAAIEAIMSEPSDAHYPTWYADILWNLPSAEPRKKGKWLPDNNFYYETRFVCSICKESEVVPTIGFTKYKPIWNFCPNCGADMREGEEE